MKSIDGSLDGRLIDLTGRRFGRWLVLRRDPAPVRAGTRWIVRCDCKREKSINGQALRRGLTTQCKECREPFWVGQKIGMRTLIGRAPPYWIARCDECGARTRCTPRHLESHGCQRCGLREDDHGRMVTVNGETHSLAGWARKIGISREAVRIRIVKGMTPEAACTTPRRAA